MGDEAGGFQEEGSASFVPSNSSEHSPGASLGMGNKPVHFPRSGPQVFTYLDRKKIFQDFKLPLIAPQSCLPEHSHRSGYKNNPSLHVFISDQDRSSSKPCSTCRRSKSFLILAAWVHEANCGSQVDSFVLQEGSLSTQMAPTRR